MGVLFWSAQFVENAPAELKGLNFFFQSDPKAEFGSPPYCPYLWLANEEQVCRLLKTVKPAFISSLTANYYFIDSRKIGERQFRYDGVKAYVSRMEISAEPFKSNSVAWFYVTDQAVALDAQVTLIKLAVERFIKEELES